MLGAAGTVGRGDGGQHQNLGALTLELVPVQQVGENGTVSGEKQVESVDPNPGCCSQCCSTAQTGRGS